MDRGRLPTNISDTKHNPPPPTTTFEFDGMIWTKKHGAMMPPTNEQLNPNDPTDVTTPPTTQWVAMPRDAYAYASGDALTNPNSTTKWHQKSPASRQLSSALMTKKSTLKWQAKSPALGRPSAPMAEKYTLKWHTTMPALAQPSALMAEKPTLKWQTKFPALGQPSALMVEKSTLEWQTKSPA